MPSLREFPLVYCNGHITEKTRVMPILSDGKSWMIYAFVWITIAECDRQIRQIF